MSLCILAPQTAIQAACRLLDEGNEVIGVGLLDDSIDSGQVARIYAMGKGHLGR
jgi:hypothetical protein